MEEMEDYEEKDYYEDIFSTRPNDYMPLIGYENIIDDVVYWVKSGNMVFIEGEEGSGKTSILFNIIRNFRGQRKVAYVDCQKLKRDVNIEKLLTNKYGLFGRLFKILPNEMIVLLDNIQFLTRKNSERVKYFFDNNNIKSVVFTAKKLSDVDMPDSLKHRIGKRLVNIPKLNSNSANQILYSRVEDFEIMDNVTVNKLYSISNYNPKQFLKNCTRVFEYAENNDKHKIVINDLKAILK